MGLYRSVNAMGKDIDLLVKNAKTYNEPGSQVFKVSLIGTKSLIRTSFLIDTTLGQTAHYIYHVFQDANNIKKIFAQRKAEMEHAEPVKSSIRIR